MAAIAMKQDGNTRTVPMPSLLWPFAAAFALTAASLATADAGHVRAAVTVEHTVVQASADCDPAATTQGGAGGSCVDLDAVVVDDIELSGAWARAMLPGQPAGGGYITITNRGTQADRLLSASSPRAGRVEIHAMEIVDDVMTMRPVGDGLAIEPGETVTLAPGGLHVMFMDVRGPFAEGESVSVTLEFEKAGPAEVSFDVRGREAAPAAAGHDGHAGHGSGQGGTHRH
jgi:periplasmic copper chaperone A